jgi:hypothetical protein
MPRKAKEKPQVGKDSRDSLGVGLFGAMLGMPAQVRLAAREQQRPAPFVPKGKRGRRGR